GPISFAFGGLFSAREKLRLLREPWAPAKRDGGEESVRSFFVRRLGPAGAFVGDAIQTGIYAGDPDRLEIGAAFPLLADAEVRSGSIVRGLLARAKPSGAKRPRPRLSSFPGGLGQLGDALAALVRQAPQ